MSTVACQISVSFHHPPDDLLGLFTSFYRVEFSCPDGPVSDSLQPEWGGVRFFTGELPRTRLADEAWLEDTDFTAMGPSSGPISFSLGTCVMWGIGLLPLGWSTLLQAPADQFADKVFDGRREQLFAGFVPLADALSFEQADIDDDVAQIVAAARQLKAGAPDPDARIPVIHEALLDPELPDVVTMADRCAINQRTLERLCRRHFGFSPKLLLRRQRFMRSLSRFMLDPDQGWIEALDTHYFDQSHFVRDCHTFIGMAPSEYAAQDHPILTAFMRERAKAHGSPAQTLDQPG